MFASLSSLMSWGIGHGPPGHAHDLSVMSRRHQAQGEASGGRWQVAGGRRQQTGAGRREAEIGVHFLWGVPRCVERQEPGGRW